MANEAVASLRGVRRTYRMGDQVVNAIDGVEVCRRLRAAPESAHVMVVALTGNPSQELAEEFLAAGAVACLSKPINLAKVREVLDLNQEEEATL